MDDTKRFLKRMDIISDVLRIDQILEDTNAFLEASYGIPPERNWSFPDGSTGSFPTWSLGSKTLLLGFSTKHRMNSGRPIVLALKQSASALTPTVEINIPPQPNKRVQGCFAFDEHRRLWFCHRGSRLTVQAYQRKRLKKQMIHRYFRDWLVLAREQSDKTSVRESYVIRVTPLPGKNTHRNLRSFAKRVEELKKAWVEYKGDERKMMRFISRNPA